MRTDYLLNPADRWIVAIILILDFFDFKAMVSNRDAWCNRRGAPPLLEELLFAAAWGSTAPIPSHQLWLWMPYKSSASLVPRLARAGGPRREAAYQLSRTLLPRHKHFTSFTTFDARCCEQAQKWCDVSRSRRPQGAG